MPDLEKVIKGLEHCGSADMCDNCPYLVKDIENEGDGCQMFADALTLLKAKEPVKAVADGEDSYMCNNCGTVIGWAEWGPGGIEEVKYKFCPECGRAVKWDD